MAEPAPFLAGLRTMRLHIDRMQGAVTLLVLLVSALAAFAVHDYGEVASALVFVLGITIAGALSGLVAALIAAVVAFAIYNFYLTEPALTFRIAGGGDLAPLVAFNLCALVSGVLAGRLKDHAEDARSTNLQLNGLLALSHELQSALRLADIVGTLGRGARTILGAEVALFRIDGDRAVSLDARPESADWTDFALRTDRGPKALRVEKALIGRRLGGGAGAMVMVAVPLGAPRLKPAVVDALGNMVALAIERAALSDEITERRAAARAEELKSALLASVSHDFRTPLTAISASASSLLAYGAQLDPDTSAKLLRGIVEEGDRLNRYTANLLEMSRIEAGGSPQPLQILSATEMVAAAIQRVRPRAGDRQFALIGTDPEPLVAANAALFELVLINILDNAVGHSDDGTRIQASLSREMGACRIDIADAGHGIPEAALHRVFDRFYREGRTEGSGLGLAIARGFVEALGGTIEARVPGLDGRGSCITIRLPLVEGALT
ncbi:sensor histidine kinase [Sphingomonas rustica]